MAAESYDSCHAGVQLGEILEDWGAHLVNQHAEIEEGSTSSESNAKEQSLLTVAGSHTFYTMCVLVMSWPGGEEKHLPQKSKALTVSRADEALSSLGSVPELVHERWKMEQFDTFWARLYLYVRDGKPSGQPKLNLFRDYKGTELRRKGTSPK